MDFRNIGISGINELISYILGYILLNFIVTGLAVLICKGFFNGSDIIIVSAITWAIVAIIAIDFIYKTILIGKIFFYNLLILFFIGIVIIIIYISMYGYVMIFGDRGAILFLFLLIFIVIWWIIKDTSLKDFIKDFLLNTKEYILSTGKFMLLFTIWFIFGAIVGGIGETTNYFYSIVAGGILIFAFIILTQTILGKTIDIKKVADYLSELY